MDYVHRARRIRERIGTPRSVALCRRLAGEVLGQLGRFEDAITELSMAAEVLAELNDLTQQAKTLTGLGSTYLRWERAETAAEVLATAVELAERVGSPNYRADALTALGDAALRMGDPARAEGYLSTALTIYEASGDPKAAVVTATLTDIRRRRPIDPEG